MATVNKIEEVLRNKLAKYAKAEPVVVGFTQSYALYVHENKQAFHAVGQAKFLEQPARQLRKELGKVVNATVEGGGTLQQGLVSAGLRLQREAQNLTPVDTGALKASAFTALESNVDAAAAKTHATSEKVRKATLKQRAKKR